MINPFHTYSNSVRRRGKKYLQLLVVFCIGISVASKAQQQNLFSNFLLNPYQYNAAYAGVVLGTQFNMAYRNQWVGFAGAPKEFMCSGWGNLNKHPEMALGGMIVNNRAGLIQRTSFQGSYSYHLKINTSYTLSFGLAFGGVQYNVKMYDAKPYDQDDNFMNANVLKAFAFDANSGFHLYSKKFFLGLSNQQMLNSSIHWANTSGRLTPHYYIYTGYNFKLDSAGAWVLQPSILSRISGPSPLQFDYSLKLIYKELLWCGATVRHRFESVKAGGNYSEIPSASILFGCSWKKSLNFGYAYDFITSGLSNYSSGSHEVFLSYRMPFRHKRSAAELAKEADETELNTIDNSVKSNIRNKKKNQQKDEKKPGTEKKEPQVQPEAPSEDNKIEDKEGEDKPK
ncbi:MAG TPA: type IX secretion system membrane protein PorP/SprF [Bacteroidia bacterium]|nr:type IX secretion system membrane protein PorP/SprF [Bacteroidia bacterium]